MKKRKNRNNKRKNALYNILDFNYFHICVEHKEKNKTTWKIYYKNLPSKVYYSKQNESLLTSEKNTIDDIYKLKKKFEEEKSKIFKDNIREYIKIDSERFYSMLKIKQKCSYILLDFFTLALIVSLINLFFINDTKISILNFFYTIFVAITGTFRLTQIQKEFQNGKERMKETFIKEKIRRQGLYFIQKLKGDEKEWN